MMTVCVFIVCLKLDSKNYPADHKTFSISYNRSKPLKLFGVKILNILY